MLSTLNACRSLSFTIILSTVIAKIDGTSTLGLVLATAFVFRVLLTMGKEKRAVGLNLLQNVTNGFHAC